MAIGPVVFDIRYITYEYTKICGLRNLVSTEEHWQMLKDAIYVATNKCIPTKYTKTCIKLPWINPVIKQKMKTRKHLYDKAKQTNTHTDWCAYKQARNEVNSLLEMHIATIALNCLKILVHAKSGFGHILKIKKRSLWGCTIE